MSFCLAELYKIDMQNILCSMVRPNGEECHFHLDNPVVKDMKYSLSVSSLGISSQTDENDKQRVVARVNYNSDLWDKLHIEQSKVVSKPVNEAEWMWEKDHYYCSKCGGNRFPNLFLGLDAAYCSYCGAKMRFNKLIKH